MMDRSPIPITQPGVNADNPLPSEAFVFPIKLTDPTYSWDQEMMGMIPYKGILYFWTYTKGIGTIYAFNGSKVTIAYQEALFYPGWAYLLWNDLLLIGAYRVVGGAAQNVVMLFNGSTWSFHRIPAGGTILSFAIYDNENRVYLYAAPSPAGSQGVVCYSTDGRTWVQDAGFNNVDTPTTRIGCSIVQYGDNLYVFESWNVAAPMDIFRKAAGVWTTWHTYADLYGINQWETACGRQTYRTPFPFTDKYFVLLGSHQNEAYIFDGSKLLKFYEGFRPAMLARNHMPKFIMTEAGMFMVVGKSSGDMGSGELWLWDGMQLWKILETPFRLNTVEFYKGRLYANGNTTSIMANPGAATLRTANSSALQASHNQGFVVSLPFDVLNHKELPPLQRRAWVDKAITAADTLYTDDDGGVMIPCLGYKRKTIYIKDTTTATLTVEVDPDGLGNWEIFYVGGAPTTALAANTILRIFTDEGFTFLRLKVLQGVADGVLNARVLLE